MVGEVEVILAQAVRQPSPGASISDGPLMLPSRVSLMPRWMMGLQSNV